MTTPRHTARLAPATVTAYSQGEVAPVRGGRRRRRADAVADASPVAERTIPPVLLRATLDAAGGDPNRLWFDADGAVWVLNHPRAERCPSPACPACSSGG